MDGCVEARERRFSTSEPHPPRKQRERGPVRALARASSPFLFSQEEGIDLQDPATLSQLFGRVARLTEQEGDGPAAQPSLSAPARGSRLLWPVSCW